MLKNYIDEDYLQGYQPRITEWLRTEDDDWNNTKLKANEFVYNDLFQRGYDSRQLMPELSLRSSSNEIILNETSEGIEDTITRRRLVLDNIAVTNSVLTLQGSDDNSNWYDITAVTLTSTSESVVTELFFDTYKYYRISTVVTSGTADFRASIVETVYDPLFACKWLAYIFLTLRNNENDRFDLLRKDYEEMYTQHMNSVKIYIDSNKDGVPDSVSRTGTIQFIR